MELELREGAKSSNTVELSNKGCMGTGAGWAEEVFVAIDEGFNTFEERLEAGVLVEFAVVVCVIFNKLGICDCWGWGWDSCSRKATKACTKLSLEWEPKGNRKCFSNF